MDIKVGKQAIGEATEKLKTMPKKAGDKVRAAIDSASSSASKATQTLENAASAATAVVATTAGMVVGAVESVMSPSPDKKSDESIGEGMPTPIQRVYAIRYKY